jgi:hypothetical protein
LRVCDTSAEVERKAFHDGRVSLVKLTRYVLGATRSSIAGKFWAGVIAWAWLTHLSFAQQKLDQLFVYGDNFLFGVKEPPGWIGDITNAEGFEANVVLHESGRPRDSWSGLIRIRVNPKASENTSADMTEDMRGYKAQFPNAQFKDLSVTNPRYPCLAKLFYIPGESYEYVAYVNPAPKQPILFSVSMNTQKSEASAKELEAYKLAVQSLTLLKAKS